MRELFKRLYNLEPYTNQVERRQAIAAYIVIATIAVLFILVLPAIVYNYFVQPDMVVAGSGQVFVLPVLVLIGWLALQSGSMWVMRFLFFGAGLLTYFYAVFTVDSIFVILLLPAFYIAMGALILSWQGVIAVGVGFVTILAYGFWQQNILTLSDITTVAFVYGLIALLNTVLARGWQQGLTHVTEEAAGQRLRMVELSSEVSQLIFQRTDMETLLNDTVNAIRDRFDAIYHAQIFLVDEERRYAILKASTGRAGKELLWRGHRLEVGSESVIGRVTIQGGTVLARDTSSDSMHFRNELLPATRTELALPLVSDQLIIGALDVQSSQADAFTQDDIGILEALASQIAIAIDNAQLFVKQQTMIAENERLVQQAQIQVRQIQDLNQRLTHQAWGEYLAQQDLAPALTVDFNSAAMTPNATWTPGLAEAVNSGKMVKQIPDVTTPDETTAIAVPLIIRGQVIGAMEFEVSQSATPTLDDENLIQNVASRLALSLESSRLYDEAQRLAQREQIINDITSRLQTASGMEGALLMAAQGLQTALNAPHIAIRLGTPPAASSLDNGSTEQKPA